jgi:hypothetical protein
LRLKAVVLMAELEAQHHGTINTGGSAPHAAQIHQSRRLNIINPSIQATQHHQSIDPGGSTPHTL